MTAPVDLDLTDPREVDKLRNAAVKGRLAAEALAAAELASRTRRTAELAQAQEQYDRELCARAQVEDAELARQRTEAQSDLDAAAYAGALDRAADAWRRGRMAKLAQRQLRDEWRQAHTRCGIGTAPPEPSLRQAEDDEAHTFARELDRTMEKAAQTDAETAVADLVGDRPSAPASELLLSEADTLDHAPSCPDPSRTERATAPTGSRSTGRVLRCISCSASQVLFIPEPEPEELAAKAKGAPVADARLPAPGERPGSGA